MAFPVARESYRLLAFALVLAPAMLAPAPTSLAQAPISVLLQEQQAEPPVVRPESTKKRDRTVLLPGKVRLDIWRRLTEVRKEIEDTESEMFKLSKTANGSLVASRERWQNELQRIQSDIRVAERDLGEAEAKSAAMQAREKELRDASAQELAKDEPLKILREKKAIFEERLASLDAREIAKVITKKTKPTVRDSILVEINDIDMEIAQREESLRRSYKGGQAEQIVKDLANMKIDVAVKQKALDVLTERFKEIDALSEDISKYAKFEREVEMLQISHRKLAELHAQQEVEYLRSLDPRKEKVEFPKN